MGDCNQYKLIYTGLTFNPYDFSNKQDSVNYYISKMLTITQSMFEYEGLPDTIPQRDVELMLQVNKHIFVTKVQDKLYAFSGNMGGEPNPYYMPTLYVIANPALNYSASLEINKDGILIPNDSLYMGLEPMFRRYATLLTENDISLRLASINSRIMSLISSSDDSALKSAKEYLKNIEEGKLGAIGESAFLDGIKTNDFAKVNSNITQLIELHQYLKASWYNDIGLNSNYNMKREAINSGESQLNFDALLPLVDDMLKRRQEGWDKVNEMYGTNIKVKLSSSWSIKLETMNEPQEVTDETERTNSNSVQ